MTEAAIVNVALAPDLDDQVAEVATALNRPKSWVIEQAVREYVELQAWQLAAIDEGIRAADEGRTVPHEEVVAWVASWGTHHELPMPKCK